MPREFSKKKFKKVQAKPHTEQVIWFLNGFWDDLGEAEAEVVWNITHKFIEIDWGVAKLYGSRSKIDDRKEGQELDQFQSHRLLEHFGETKTASQLRKDLSTIDVDKNNHMSITEYLMFKYSKTAAEVINAPQGQLDSTELKAAEDAMTAAKETLDVLNEKLADAKTAEDNARTAQAEAKETLDALNREQAKYDKQCAKLERKAADDSIGIVKQGAAKNKLAALKSQDPLPLNRAKLNQGAAVKKAKKATKKAGKATAKADAAAEAAAKSLAVCEAAFQELKRQGGVAQGKIFWLEREMKEIKKYMPGRKKRFD